DRGVHGAVQSGEGRLRLAAGGQRAGGGPDVRQRVGLADVAHVGFLASGRSMRGIRSGSSPLGRIRRIRMSEPPISISRSAATCTGFRPGTTSVRKRVDSMKNTTS